MKNNWLLNLVSSLNKSSHWSKEDLYDVAEATKHLKGESENKIEQGIKEALRELDEEHYYGTGTAKSFAEAIPFVQYLWDEVGDDIKPDLDKEDEEEKEDEDNEEEASDFSTSFDSEEDFEDLDNNYDGYGFGDMDNEQDGMFEDIEVFDI